MKDVRSQRGCPLMSGVSGDAHSLPSADILPTREVLQMQTSARTKNERVEPVWAFRDVVRASFMDGPLPDLLNIILIDRKIRLIKMKSDGRRFGINYRRSNGWYFAQSRYLRKKLYFVDKYISAIIEPSSGILFK